MNTTWLKAGIGSLVLSAGLIVIAGPAEAAPANGLAATYFDNADLTGSQVNRVDPTVNFEWYGGSPAAGIGADTFSARWTGQIDVPTTGTYTFTASTDDGSRLWIDDTTVVNAWFDHSLRDDSGQITLTAGSHRIRFEYYENGWDAIAKLSWAGPGISRQIIPTDRLTVPLDPISATTGLFVDPNSHAAVWARNNPADPRAARIKSEIADRSTAAWFGDWSGDVRAAVSGYLNSAGTKLPTVVAYNIPNRDCDGSGGSGSAEAYRHWISEFASGIGSKPAIVIIEPDAVPLMNCDPSANQIRRDLLRFATEQLRDRAPNAWTYLDGGSPDWVDPDEIAQRLDGAGVRNVRGFSVNVSSFHSLAKVNTYLGSVNTSLANRYGYRRQTVIDTSRNGNGATGGWCNPAGVKLGTPPRQATGEVDLMLWVKMPGDSDRECGIAPTLPAGTFSPDLAIRLIEGW